MACALADSGGAPLSAWPEPLDRGALVGMDRLDVQVLTDQVVVVFRIRDRGFEQLAPVTRDRTRRGSEDLEMP
jgi:hypothetical protein